MKKNSDIVLFVSSDMHTGEQASELVKQSFENVISIIWQMGNNKTRANIREQLDQTNYDLIISYFNGLIFRPSDLAKVKKGAINIHPAPPEHPGAWGLWCQPIIQRHVRSHHGITIHEMDEKIDHGPIYYTKRWDVPPECSIEELETKSGEECLKALTEITRKLAAARVGTRCLNVSQESWSTANGHHKVEDIREWFSTLHPEHPAHKERVWFNHPEGLAYPPYFSDIME